ncbi:hypothetical protein [Streptomyces sp. NPDC057460]|uniref:hypothetical protein n=1 Tax=Streptomyces sp. NPDC057460 TaxID=3346141 RepID=UPI003683873B
MTSSNFSLARSRRGVVGSGLSCRITSLVEVVRADEIDAAYDTVAAGDVRYRCVIDIATMATG